MMKNKKIISLICALAMIFSMFSAMTVVNAEDAKGINLAGSLSDDGKTITLDATAVGTNGTLNNFMVAVNVPDGVTLDDITLSDATLTKNVADGVLYVAFLDLTGYGKSYADGKLVTITIALDSPLSSNYVATLTGDAAIEDTDGAVDVDSGTMAAASTTVAKWQDPNVKPDTVERPAKEESSSDSEVPSVVPVEGKGIELDASIDKTNKVITIDATAVGTNGTLNNFMVALELPTGVTLDDITVSDETLTKNVADGVLYVAFLDLTGYGKSYADGKLVTITINLPEALTAPLSLSLTDDAAIEDTDGAVDCTTGMTKTNAVVTPYEEEPTTVKTVNLKDYVGKDGSTTGAEAAKAAQDAGKTVYLTVDVKKADGTDAEYGVDYAAEYPAGVVLSKEEYNNLIHGYTDADMADVINNLKFNIYNNDVKTISTTLNAEGDETQLVDPVTDKTIGKTTTVTKKTPSLSHTGYKSSVSVDTSVDIKTTVNVGDYEVGTLTVEASDTSWNYVNGKGIQITVADDNKSAEVKFGANKKGSVKLTYTYVYDKDGTETTITDTKTIKITDSSSTSSSSSSSSSSNSSGTGPIANGNFTSTGTTPTGVNFTDLDSVSWAKQAITALAAKGIVSGRDGSTFDPNANITRAEYCQILIGAIEKTNDYADVSFDDVATNAWYYHAVAVASQLGIVEGYGDGNFGPDNQITRQDMALMTYKAALATGVSVDAVRSLVFDDANQISDYAATAVQTLANAGIISGVSDTEFAPQDNATRAQAAVILYTTFVK